VDGPLGLGGLFAALTNGSGNLSVPLRGGVSGLSLGGLGTLSVELVRLELAGLDSLGQLQLLPPPRTAPADGTHTLSISLDLSSLLCTLTLTRALTLTSLTLTRLSPRTRPRISDSPQAHPGAHTLSLGANLSALDLALEMRISLAPRPNASGTSAGFHAPPLNETLRVLLRVRRAALGAQAKAIQRAGAEWGI